MPTISLSQAMPGMVLAKPVMRPNSSVAIAGEGLKLTQEYIDRFKSSGISTVSVRGPVPGVEETLDFKKILGQLDSKFTRYNGDKFMSGMRLLAKQYFQRKLDEQQAIELLDEDEAAAETENSGKAQV